MRQKKVSKSRIIWGIIFTIALIIFLISGYKLITYFLSDGGDTERYLEITTTNFDSSQFAENHNINWTKLKEDNRDIYSWIYIPNTKVDYPVVQSSKKEPDDFYLNHNIHKKYEFAGAIYSEKHNTLTYSDPVTILYGHNMNNGSMFKTLHKFEEPSFFKKNKYIYIYMPNRKLTFKIYAAYEYDDRHIINSFDFSDKKILKKYQKYTLNPDSMIKNTRKVSLNTNSKIIALSTCTNGAENTRYLVQGVLIKDEQTN
ncbi:MAG: class B sortase [Eubacterium sp.]|nr:class B sortase [Eubacterium sp.]